MGTVESLQRRRVVTEHSMDQSNGEVGTNGQQANGVHTGSRQSQTAVKNGPVPRCFGAPLVGGRYHLGPVLGSGSSATVFIGWDSVAQCKVALKRLEPRAVWERRRECALATSVTTEGIRTHPLLVCPRDVIWLDQMKHHGTDESTRDFLLVMNLQGPDLRSTLRQQQGLRFHDLAPALFDLLEAVSFLHEAGYLHRDIKPENCFWSRDRRLLLGDFGLTRKIERSLTPQMVTRWYRAPELLLGSTNYSKGIDVFAIGVIAVEMMTGVPLFPGDTEVGQLDLLLRFLRGPEADTDTSVERSMDPEHPSSRRRRRILDAILESKPRIVATTAAYCPPTQRKKIGPLLTSFIELLAMLMAWNPKSRPSANDAKDHVFFAQAHSLGWL